MNVRMLQLLCVEGWAGELGFLLVVGGDMQREDGPDQAVVGPALGSSVTPLSACSNKLQQDFPVTRHAPIVLCQNRMMSLTHSMLFLHSQQAYTLAKSKFLRVPFVPQLHGK